jgi:hypothetical protein
MTIDGSDANEAAIKRYNEEHGTAIIIRQVKYVNNLIEQDHRSVKRVIRPMLGFKSFEAAQATLIGIELMHMLKKRQLIVEAGAEGLTAAEPFSSLAASSPHGQGQLPLHDLPSNICDTTVLYGSVAGLKAEASFGLSRLVSPLSIRRDLVAERV